MPRPDDGLIHAWLDGQLPPDEAARIEALAATDPEWAAAVVEARGLVAASSRILSALDHVPAGVVPARKGARTGRQLPWWTKIAAAVVVVVGGSVVVLQNAPNGRVPALSTEEGSAQSALDALKPVVQAPASSTPVQTPSPTATARGSVSTPAAGVSGRRRDGATLGKEELATQPVTSPPAPTRTANEMVAEERKAVHDADRQARGVSGGKSLEAKAAPGTPTGVTPSATPSVTPSATSGAAMNPVPSAAPQAQQAAALGLAQAQNAVPAQRVVAGVSTAQQATAQQAKGQPSSLCYRLVPDSVHAGVAVIMRAVRADGDTLRLVPVESGASQRAWLVLGDGLKGVMATSGDLRSAVRVVATPTACPTP